MKARNHSFDEHAVLHHLKHFLPPQAIATDFVCQNALRAFQDCEFHDALHKAAGIFGYNTLLSPEEYRTFYNARKINPEILEKVMLERKGFPRASEWRDKVLMKKFPADESARIGELRAYWKTQCKTDLNSIVHPKLFRILCSYLDQGVSVWRFPVHKQGLLASVREMEVNSLSGFFRKPRARNLLLHTEPSINDLLAVIVGDEQLFERYLFDQQFAHPGWSGMVSLIEGRPETLSDRRTISLQELIIFELLLEIDALDAYLGDNWEPLAKHIREYPEELFGAVPTSEISDVQSIWQEALEWSYYDQVLAEMTAPDRDVISHAGKTVEEHSARPPLVSGLESVFRHLAVVFKLPVATAHGDAPATQIGKKGKTGATALFEPHPGLNLATNALCIIGRSMFTKQTSSDRRAFLNPYDYATDQRGDMLLDILNEAVPVYGGINLEYFFSRVDNRRLGAGSRFLHNAIGLLGVANNVESDLRRGLPAQMVMRHDPVRLLFVVEHFPETVKSVIQKRSATYEWFIHEWVRLSVINPETQELFVFKGGEMVPYNTYRHIKGNIDDPASPVQAYDNRLPACVMH